VRNGSNVPIDELIAGGPILTNGVWGTELQARGLAPAELPDLWNLARPDRVAAVARAYVDAGSRITLTNALRANRVVLAAHGAADSVEAINRGGVAISRRAAGARFIGGCCGTTPAFVAPPPSSARRPSAGTVVARVIFTKATMSDESAF
jgi:methionine synthase I (cobalamin-dependent)